MRSAVIPEGCRFKPYLRRQFKQVCPQFEQTLPLLLEGSGGIELLTICLTADLVKGSIPLRSPRLEFPLPIVRLFSVRSSFAKSV
jgi:hypothetical protein